MLDQGSHAESRPDTVDVAPRNALKQIASRVLATIGAEFFESLVKNLAEALRADCVYLGEFVDEEMTRLRTVGLVIDGKADRAFEYDTLAGTIVEQIAARRKRRAYMRGVLTRFPTDMLLLEADAQACVAVPLLGPYQQPIGVLIAAYRHVLTNSRLAKSVLEMFAPRAAAELRRLQGEAALRESEQRYHMFIAQNPDAMWRIEFELPIPLELSEDDQIKAIADHGYLAECNEAGARLLGYEKAEQVVGFRFQDFAGHNTMRLQGDLRLAIRSGYRFSTIQLQRPAPDGTTRRLLRSHWGVIENGTLRRIWGVTKDITDLLAGRLFWAEENERKRISRELHDDLSQKVALLAIDTSRVQGQTQSAETNDALDKLHTHIVELSTDIRRIAHRLHPSVLEDLGLAATIREMCEEFTAREGVSAVLEQKGLTASLPMEIATCLYRVAQEALHNVKKHAQGASQVRLTMTGSPDNIRLCIRDNGCGFDSGASDARSGIGIVSMRERVRLVQGEFSIQSQPGEGTTISVLVPLPEERSETLPECC